VIGWAIDFVHAFYLRAFTEEWRYGRFDDALGQLRWARGKREMRRRWRRGQR